MFVSLVVLCFPKNSSLYRISALQLFELQILLLNWNPVDLVVMCRGQEAFCNLRTKSEYFRGSLYLCCDLQKYFNLTPHTLDGTERVEGVKSGNFSFTSWDTDLVRYFFLAEMPFYGEYTGEFQNSYFCYTLRETWRFFLGDSP